MEKILKSYKESEQKLEQYSLYQFAATSYITKNNQPVDIVPIFNGFDDNPCWPLTEDFAKWPLTIHCPWRDSVDTLKLNDSFAQKLEEFMWGGVYPMRLAVAIHRKQLKWVHDDSTDGGLGRNTSGTTNTGSQDSQLPKDMENQEALQAAQEVSDDLNENDIWAEEDLMVSPMVAQNMTGPLPLLVIQKMLQLPCLHTNKISMLTSRNKGQVVYKILCNLLIVQLSDQKNVKARHKKSL